MSKIIRFLSCFELASARKKLIPMLVLGIFVLSSSLLHAQTQCSNGLDDDGDSLVDAYTETSLPSQRSFGDCGQIRTFVNSFPEYDDIPSTTDYLGCAHSDPATRQKICELAGYSVVLSFTNGRWKSCGDNAHGYWIESANNFAIKNACESNVNLDGLVCGSPITDCNDGIDNDGDGAIDLSDSGCKNIRDTSEYSEDPDCSSPSDNSEGSLPQCQDGLDNDSDGRVDLSDPGCSSQFDNDESDGPVSGECRDGIDNDGDQLVDTDDPGCFGNPNDPDEAPETTQCQDGIDNDGDGAVDTADPDCAGPTDNDESGPGGNRPACSDGIDNDGDGRIDLADPGCSSSNDTSEEDPVSTACGDGIDNDGDGAIDYPNDFSCSSATDNDERNPQSECQDGFDNDNDGRVDTQDPGCQSAQDNSEDSDGSGISLDSVVLDGCNVVVNYSKSFATCAHLLEASGTTGLHVQNHFCANNGPITVPATAFSPSLSVEMSVKLCNGNNKNICSAAVAVTGNGSCSSEKQCADGSDNDGDGFTDLADPGCDSESDDNEADDPACGDGVDNDGDGKVDYPADPGCSSLRDTDEADVGRHECQDGLDNDGDGVTDTDDPGCFGDPNYPTEAKPDPECADGIDNDQNGAIDYPADSGCVARVDNDESGGGSNPGTQCSNSLDDDSDGLVDLADPGCSSSQDDSEDTATSECQDGVDNDGDSLVDGHDPGCTSPQDNSEHDSLKQCENNADDDGDGLVDLDDPGCSSSLDDSEDSETSECQNGVDDDGDGLIDYPRDPGCDSAQDDSESSQSGNVGMVRPLLECVDEDASGLITAYFSYENQNNQTIHIDVQSTLRDGINTFGEGAINKGQVTDFTPGYVPGAFSVSFNKGESLIWYLAAPGHELDAVIADETTVRCGQLKPVLICTEPAPGNKWRARFSYENQSYFAKPVPIGVRNSMAPGQSDQGQPIVFEAGRGSEFSVDFSGQSLSWTLAGTTVEASAYSPRCE